ncbi:MAG: hypothetical protein ACKOPT_06950 [Cyanobium sp.]
MTLIRGTNCDVFSMPSCRSRNGLLAMLLCVTTAASIHSNPALAGIVPEGKVSKGFYWQRVERRDGKMIVYFCRSVGQAKIQNIEACQRAGAQKP